MEQNVTQTSLWSYLSQFEGQKDINYDDLLKHFSIDPKKQTDTEALRHLNNALSKLENLGSLLVVGTTSPKIYLQETLPPEVELNFNTPKQAEKKPTVSIRDRSLITRKVDGKKFSMPQIKLNSDLSLNQLRIIDRAKVYIYRDETGQYVADISQVTARKHDKTQNEANRQEAAKVTVSNDSNKPEHVAEILDKMGILHKFPEEALQQAENLLREYGADHDYLADGKRTDLRDIPFVMIDSAKTTIRDDAVYAAPDTDEDNPGGYVLWTAIADPEYYIKRGSPLDEEAEKRGESLFLDGTNIPMFPQKLAEDLLSLNAYQDRPAKVTKIQINADGEPISHEHFDAVIHTKAALNHAQVTDALTGRADKMIKPHMEATIPALIAVTKKLKPAAIKRGFVNYAAAETYTEDENTSLPHEIVEYAMNATKLCAGQAMKALDQNKGIFRVQEAPTKVPEELIESLVQQGLLQEGEITVPEDITQDKINRLLKKARDTENPRFTKMLITKLMPKSELSSAAGSHFGLALDVYAPLSSPIRNYSDLLAMRRLSAKGLDISQENLEHAITRLNQSAARGKSALQKIRRANEERDMTISFNNPANNNAIDLFGDQDIETTIFQSMNIPTEFSPEALAEAQEILATMGNPEDLLKDPRREDLTHIPFVTIDGDDAKDFDDAVYAEDDLDPNNPGGKITWEAIADVSHYVRLGSALDKEARERASSVYPPRKVIPMLPEALSNNLCSLKPNEHRAVLACRKVIDKNGKMLGYSYHNGVIKSRARLTYNEVLDAFDGVLSDNIKDIYEPLIVPLAQSYKQLEHETERRGALHFDIPQLSIQVDGDESNPSFRKIVEDDSRKLIAEFMVASNMCAAKEQKRAKMGVYRIHSNPTAGNIEAIDTLIKLGVISGTDKKQGLNKAPENMKRLLAKADDCPDPELAKNMLIRLQAEALYSTNNIGHFALQIHQNTGYSHSTSPIRRYPDLIVHRIIKDLNGWDEGQFTDEFCEELPNILEHCNVKARSIDKAINKIQEQYYLRHIHRIHGELIDARIIGASKEGLRIRLNDLDLVTDITLEDLPKGYYSYDSSKQILANETTKHVFRVGYSIKVVLGENNNGNLSMPLAALANPDHFVDHKYNKGSQVTLKQS